MRHLLRHIPLKTKDSIERNLLISTNIWYFGEGLLGPLLAIFTKSIGGDLLDITWAWAIFLVFTGVLNMVFGYLSDHKYGKEKLMVAGYFLNAIFTFGYLFIKTTYGLFFIEAGLGVAAALSTATWDALYAKYSDRKTDGSIWGVHEGWAKIITAAAIIMGGLIVNYFSFKALFFIMGIIQTAAAIYQTRILNKKI
jgi:predicted MFS family arabinose efflux permease